MIGWLGSALSWLGSIFTGSIRGLWMMVQGVLDVGGAILVTVLGQLVGWVVALAFAILGVFTSLMPVVGVPSDGGAVAGAVAALSAANRYIPVSEMLLLLPVWGAVVGGVAVYKAWKAVPFT